MSTKQLKSAKPEIIVAMFVSSTGRCDSILMSTIGALERSSTSAQRTKNAAAAAPRPSRRSEVQPQVSPSVSATSNESKPPESSNAPGMSTREGDRIGDSGTYRCTSASESATGMEPNTKSSRQEKWSTITPDRTIPKPPPTPNTAESRPIPTLTFSAGNSSRMIAKLSGKSAPPAPETMRNAISDQMSHAAAAPRQPTRKSPRLISSSRSFPN